MIKNYKFENKTYYEVQVSFTAQNGKRHQKKVRFKNSSRLTSQREAKLFEAECLLELKARVENNYQSLSFSEFHENFLENVKTIYRKNTYMQYSCCVMKWMDSKLYQKKLGDITKSDIHKFIHETTVDMGASPNSRKRLTKSLRKIFGMALDDGLITRNPVQGISVKVPPPKKLVLNAQEASRLLTEARKCNHEFYYLWSFALLTGMRSGEMYALRWSSIDEELGIINVSTSWSSKDGYHSTKSNKTRIVPISKDLRRLLVKLRNIGKFQEKFNSPSGKIYDFDDLVLPRLKDWTRGSQARVTKNFCEIVEITPVKFHDLRATFITNILSQGVSTPQVMSIVGHSKMSTTNEYLRLSGISVKGATEMLGYSLPKEEQDNLVSFQLA